MKFIKHLLNKRICWKLGHDYRFDGYTLGGDWIRCKRCNKIDEYLPGLHEPKYYVNPKSTVSYKKIGNAKAKEKNG